MITPLRTIEKVTDFHIFCKSRGLEKFTGANRTSPKFGQLVLITWFPVCDWYNQLMILVLYSMETYDLMLKNQTIKSMVLLQMKIGCILLLLYLILLISENITLCFL